jgi:hypothetical protein
MWKIYDVDYRGNGEEARLADVLSETVSTKWAFETAKGL